MFTRENKPQGQNTNIAKKNKELFIQPKLSFGKSDDKYEVEADKMADKVVNKPKEPATVQKKESEEEVQAKPLASEITPTIQKTEAAEEEPIQKMEEEEAVQSKEEEEIVQSKEEEEVQAKCDDCENEGGVQKKEEEEVQSKEEEEIQAKEATTTANSSSSSFESQLRNGNGGKKLDNQTRNEMESGFGADFSNVNVHDDSQAQQMSNDIGAQAFTHGNDIYFNKGKYNPTSKEGKHLLAHELTHTIQQKGMVRKKDTTLTKNTIQRQPENLNPPADLACPVATTSPSGIGETLSFPVAGSSFTTAQQEGINNFVRNWHLAKEQVRIDGYASMDGAENFNWHLSCRRAHTAKNALMAPPDGSPGIPSSYISMNAHGETNQFGSLTQNRRVSINLPNSSPVKPGPSIPTFKVTSFNKSGSGNANLTENAAALSVRTPLYSSSAKVKITGDNAEISRWTIGYIQAVKSYSLESLYEKTRDTWVMNYLPMRDGSSKANIPWYHTKTKAVKNGDVISESMRDAPGHSVSWNDPRIANPNSLEKYTRKETFDAWLIARRDTGEIQYLKNIQWGFDFEVDVDKTKAVGSRASNSGSGMNAITSGNGKGTGTPVLTAPIANNQQTRSITVR